MTRWTMIQRVDKLEQYLHNNPDVFLYDRRTRERRFALYRNNTFICTVDGRSVRALFYKLTTSFSNDGGMQLAEVFR